MYHVKLITGTGLYALNIGSPSAEHSYLASCVPDLETSHHHLGHINIQSIIDMSDKGMVKGMHMPPKCQSCVLGKQTRASVPNIHQGQKAGEVLDCVYVDLTSPQSVKSTSGYLYVMNLIDDKSSAI